MIYRKSLGKPQTWKLSSKSFEGSHLLPALTRVNKQVRAEALAVYYGENTLRIQITDKVDKPVSLHPTRAVAEAETEACLKFYRVLDRAFARGTGTPGLSIMSFLQRLDVVFYHQWDPYLQGFFVGRQQRFEVIRRADYLQMTFSLRQGADKHDDESTLIYEDRSGNKEGGDGKVGNASTDWKSCAAVNSALRRTMAKFGPICKKQDGDTIVEYGMLEVICPMHHLVGILWRCAKEWPDANCLVTFSWRKVQSPITVLSTAWQLRA